MSLGFRVVKIGRPYRLYRKRRICSPNNDNIHCYNIWYNFTNPHFFSPINYLYNIVIRNFRSFRGTYEGIETSIALYQTTLRPELLLGRNDLLLRITAV